MKFFKVTTTNQWYHIETFVDGKNIRDMVARHQRLSVMWPDGEIRLHPAEMRALVTSYGDMGHTYDAHSDIPWIQCNLFGALVWMRLDSLPVEVGVFDDE